MNSDATIDARGLKCPLPVLKAEKQAASLKPGQGFTLLATDPVARVDVPHFCQTNSLVCSLAEVNGVLSFKIAKPVETG